jgi:large subunit ribosomal protein L23
VSGSTKSGPRDVILAPVVSEKSYSLSDQSAYTFLVHPRANKTEIRQAVESIWDVRVAKVNTANRKGKTKRFRMTLGKRPDTKRAVVTLGAGEKIDIFEQQA